MSTNGADTEAVTTMEDFPELSMKGVYQIMSEEQYK
jgi:hypothetical protein